MTERSRSNGDPRQADRAPRLQPGGPDAPLSTPELLDAFFDSAIDLLCIADLSGRFLRLNSEWVRTLGYRMDELVGRQFLELVHPDDRAATLEAIAHLAAGKNVAGFTNRYRCRDGGYRWIEWRSTPLGADLIAAAARDVTATRRQEEQLRESEAALRRTQMLVRLGHWRLDAATRVIRCSEEIIHIFELSPEFTVDEFLAAVQPSDRPRVQDAVMRGMQEGAAYDVEYDIVLPNGSARHVRTIGQPVIGADGRVASVLGTAQDLTERHEEQERQRRFEAQIQQLQKLESLGVLAGGIAHDFNNMLMAIVGNAELALQDEPSTAGVRPMLEAILEACGRATDLCRQMLAYSGRGQFVLRRIDLSRLIVDTREMLQVSVSKRATLRYRLARGLPAIEADPSQLRQVLINLVTNASEALGEASGTVTVTTEEVRADRAVLDRLGAPRLAEGRYVVLHVEDDGCGMDAGTRQRIFEPFFTTKFTGRGLGLAAVHGIVQSQKGAISVWSEPGEGSRFTLLFPARTDSSLEAGPAVDAEVRQDWGASGLVLLVDDEEGVRAVGRRLLERTGFEVMVAADGRAGVEAFRANHARLRCVLLDLTMPRLDGEAALREMRGIDPSVPVVLCSGYTALEADRLTGSGAAGFVEKPYRRAELVAVLKRVLERCDAGARG